MLIEPVFLKYLRIGDGSFDSDNTRLAKLKFGKSGSTPIEWYILGKDDQVKDGKGSTDNIAIFAANNITSTAFYKDWVDHSYVGDVDEAYVTEGEKPSTVYANHYGESDIREVLRKLAGEEKDTAKDYDKYFTDAEKKMMQKTKVLSHECGNNHLYTIHDKLYLASGYWYNQDYIYVGSVSKSDSAYEVDNEYTSIKLSCEPYWKLTASDDFWLRSPSRYIKYGELFVHLGSDLKTYVSNEFVIVNYGVRPASNLNLSSVSFASAAEAETASDSGAVKTIDRGTDTAPNEAMMLRLNGDSKSAETALGGTIGSVKLVNNSKVVITRGTAVAAVTLIIQGKDGDTDWYYAKNITAANTSTPVTASDITGHTSTDLSKCMIWLEAPMGDGSTLSYAVKATNHTHSYGSDDTWYHDEEYHYKRCTICESDKSIKADTKAEHEYSTDGICTICGYDISNVHTLEQVDEVEPTCTSVGYKSYYRCKDEGCDVKYYSALGILIRLTDIFEIELPKAEHVESESYSHDSSSHWLKCVNCGAQLKKESHKLSSDYSSDDTKHWKVCTVCDAELEITEHNYRGNTCTACGYEKPRSTARNRSSESLPVNKNNVTQGVWERDSRGWRYKLLNGSYAGYSNSVSADSSTAEADSAENTNNAADGYWYYLDPLTGKMLSGWQLINSNEYYLAPAPQESTYTYDSTQNKWVYNNVGASRPYGAMYADVVTPDGYYVDADGVKIK